MHTILQPEGWAKPVGYANGVAARGRMVFVGGQVGWTGQGKFETDDFVGQVGRRSKTSWPSSPKPAPGPSTSPR